MPKFTRTANKNDLKPGAHLIYRDQEVYVYGDHDNTGEFSASLGLELIVISKFSIGQFQVAIKPLTVVK